MGEVIYRIFGLTVIYAILGFLFNIFFPKSFWIFSLIFLSISVGIIWDAIKENKAREKNLRALKDLNDEYEEMCRFSAELQAKTDAEDQIKFAEAERLLPTYKSEYERALQRGNKVLAYKLGMRYYLAGNLVEKYYGTENEIAQRVKNEIDIYSK